MAIASSAKKGNSIWDQIKKNKISYAFTLPYYILFFVFTVMPVVVSIILSFTSFNMLETPQFIGIDNYLRLFFSDSTFIIALKNTILIALIVGPGGYLLCMMLAWMINELTPKVRAVVTLIFYAPSISGNMFLIWNVLFSGDTYGYINSILLKLNIINKPILWLYDPKYITGIVIAVSLWLSLGTSFLSFIAGFQGISKSYYEAAAVDGIKNRWQELWFITLPLIRPQMMFSAVMSITGAFNVGGVITGLCGFPSTDYTAHTIMNHLEDYGGMRFEMGYASAIATLLFFIMIITNIFCKKLIGKVGE